VINDKLTPLIGSVVAGLLSITLPVQASPKLRVGVYVLPPYVRESQVLTVNDVSPPNNLAPSKPSLSPKSSAPQPKYATRFDGISIEIWQKIATSENLEYEYYIVKDTDTGINQVAKGSLDLLVGPIAVTPERLKKVAFTYPYYVSYPALLVPSHPPNLWQLIHPFLQRAAILTVVGLFILIFLVANIIWLVEHKHNPEQFPPNYFKGVRDAYWFLHVTMTTVGYGDKVPVTPTGRFVTYLWMWISLVITSSITAGLATTFTLALTQQPTQKFSNPQDLQNEKVAVVAGTYLVNLTAEYKMTPVLAKSLNHAINLLYSGQVEAVLDADQSLRYYLKQNPKVALTTAPLHSSPLSFGFVLPQNSLLLNKFNIDLLQMQQDKVIPTIIHKWMG
jgi:polar amino acid transport system substrate-binding protein